jgi:TonB family protein
LKFHLSLLISVLIHLLLLSLLSRTHPVRQEKETVFNVDIIAAAEVEKGAPEEIVEEAVPPPVMEEEPPGELIKPDPVKPKAIYIEGEDEGEAGIEPDAGPDTPDASDYSDETGSDKVPDKAGKEEDLPSGENVFALALESSLYIKESVEQRRSPVPQKKKALLFGDLDRIDSIFIRQMLEKIRSIERSIEEDISYDKHPDLYAGVVLNRDGSVADVMILRPSGHIRIDEAVLKHIKEAEPWPFPGKGYDEEQYGFSWHYIYGVKVRYTVEQY